MNKLVLFCLIFFFSAYCNLFSQEIGIKDVEFLTTDISARTQPCFDLNGDPCALIKVKFVAPNAEFSGNIIKVVPQKGEYWVYMVAGSKILYILHDALLPCKINFTDYGINKLEEKTTYGITLSIPESIYAVVVSQKGTGPKIEDVFSKVTSDSIADKVEHLIDNKDYLQAFTLAKEGYEKGSIGSCYLLAVMYYNGWGTEKSAKLGHEYSGYAAQKGHRRSQRNYGLDLIDGRGCDKDEKEGVRWIEIAAQNNDIDAQTDLSLIYRDGLDSVNPDLTKSFKWALNAAEQNDTIAQEEMGFKYSEGIGVAKNPKKAFEWFSKAANGGKATSFTCLGVSYRDGEGVPRDYKKAEEYFIKGAELGDPHGAYLTGYLYERYLRTPETRDKVLIWYEKASEMGDKYANELLLDAYTNGDILLGISPDSNKAQLYRDRLNKFSESE